MRMLIVFGVALLGAVTACSSAQAGSPGTTNAGDVTYTSRQQVECYSSIMTEDQVEVSATCKNVEDLPLSGGCSLTGWAPDTLADAALAVNGPWGWNATADPAEWSCGWVRGGSLVSIPGAQATICCIVKSRVVLNSQ
jgi:hypothetical protein